MPLEVDLFTIFLGLGIRPYGRIQAKLVSLMHSTTTILGKQVMLFMWKNIVNRNLTKNVLLVFACMML